MKKPFIGIINSYNEIVPGICTWISSPERSKRESRAAGGIPFEMGTIAICDGITMNHAGMKYSYPAGIDCRSAEVVVEAHASMRGFHPELR